MIDASVQLARDVGMSQLRQTLIDLGALVPGSMHDLTICSTRGAVLPLDDAAHRSAARDLVSFHLKEAKRLAQDPACAFRELIVRELDRSRAPARRPAA
jgi:hypothetical protein